MPVRACSPELVHPHHIITPHHHAAHLFGNAGRAAGWVGARARTQKPPTPPCCTTATLSWPRLSTPSCLMTSRHGPNLPECFVAPPPCLPALWSTHAPPTCRAACAPASLQPCAWHASGAQRPLPDRALGSVEGARAALSLGRAGGEWVRSSGKSVPSRESQAKPGGVGPAFVQLPRAAGASLAGRAPDSPPTVCVPQQPGASAVLLGGARCRPRSCWTLMRTKGRRRRRERAWVLPRLRRH